MTEYQDTIQIAQRVHPVTDGKSEFDFDAVCRHLDGEKERENPMRDSEKFSGALSVILDWLLTPDQDRIPSARTIGFRAIALAWVIDPARFGDASLHKIAQRNDCSAANISPLTAEVRMLFGIKNENQSHDWRNKQ